MIKKIFLSLSFFCCSTLFSSQSPADHHCLICPKESRESLKISFQQSIENIHNIPHETFMKIFDHIETLESSFLSLFPNEDLNLYDAVQEYYMGKLNYNEEENIVFPLAQPVHDKIIESLESFIEEHKFHEEQLGGLCDLLQENFSLMVKINFLTSLGEEFIFPPSFLKMINIFTFSLLIFNMTTFHWVYNQDSYNITTSMIKKQEFIQKCQEKIL